MTRGHNRPLAHLSTPRPLNQHARRCRSPPNPSHRRRHRRSTAPLSFMATDTATVTPPSPSPPPTCRHPPPMIAATTAKPSTRPAPSRPLPTPIPSQSPPPLAPSTPSPPYSRRISLPPPPPAPPQASCCHSLFISRIRRCRRSRQLAADRRPSAAAGCRSLPHHRRHRLAPVPLRPPLPKPLTCPFPLTPAAAAALSPTINFPQTPSRALLLITAATSCRRPHQLSP